MPRKPRKLRPNEIKAQIIKTNMDKLQIESGIPAEQLNEFVGDALCNAYDLLRMDGPNFDIWGAERTYTRIAYRFHRSRNDWASFPRSFSDNQRFEKTGDGIQWGA